MDTLKNSLDCFNMKKKDFINVSAFAATAVQLFSSIF